MKNIDFSNNKLGGNNRILLYNDTMQNIKCKNLNKQSENNTTDALCIMEVKKGITEYLQYAIPNKLAFTIVPLFVRS